MKIEYRKPAQAVSISLLLSLTSTGADAVWVTLHGGGPDNAFIIEDQAIKKIGAKVSFWAISDFTPKAGDERLGRSGTVNYEGDCENRTLEVVYMRLHKDPYGKGEVTFVNSVPFRPALSSEELKMLDYVCSKY